MQQKRNVLTNFSIADLKQIFFRLGLWFVGNILALKGDTCGELDGCHYIGKGQYTRRPCVKSPGHFGICRTEWEWNEALNTYIRFHFIDTPDGKYAISEIKE